MTLTDLKTALLTLTVPVYRYRAVKGANVPYIVWSEDSTSDLIADDKHAERRFEGTVDYFTKTEDDATVAQIEALLDSLPIYWNYENILFEEDTNIIHHVFIFRV